MLPLVEKFRAVSPDGYETILLIRPSPIPPELRDNPDPDAPGALEACTIDGHFCGHLGDHTFQIVGDPRQPGRIVRAELPRRDRARKPWPRLDPE